MIKMKKEGMTLKGLASHFNVSESTVEYHVYPELREKRKIYALQRMQRVRDSWTPEQVAESNRKTAEYLKRKAQIQPEYIKYNTIGHNKYSKTEKAVEVRKKYYKKNIQKFREMNRKKYLNRKDKMK